VVGAAVRLFILQLSSGWLSHAAFRMAAARLMVAV